MTRIFLPSLLILALAACGNEPAGKTTTKLEAVEVEPGTISDSMIILDDASGDGTAVDNSIPDDGTAKVAKKANDEAAGESDGGEKPSDDETSTPSDTPTKSDAPTPAKKADE